MARYGGDSSSKSSSSHTSVAMQAGVGQDVFGTGQVRVFRANAQLKFAQETEVRVTVIGRGGNGGLGGTATNQAAGGGGGGGGFSRGVITLAVNEAVSIAVATFQGSSSSFGSYMSATCGSAGGNASGNTGGAGGAGGR